MSELGQFKGYPPGTGLIVFVVLASFFATNWHIHEVANEVIAAIKAQGIVEKK